MAGDRGAAVKTFLRDNGLTIALLAMFLFSLSGMVMSGQAAGRPPRLYGDG
jgi:hypothetical protein